MAAASSLSLSQDEDAEEDDAGTGGTEGAAGVSLSESLTRSMQDDDEDAMVPVKVGTKRD